MRYVVHTSGEGNQIVIPPSVAKHFSKDIQIVYDDNIIPANIQERGSFNFSDTVTSYMETSSFLLSHTDKGYCIEHWIKPNFSTAGDFLYYYSVEDQEELSSVTLSVPEDYENLWVHLALSFLPVSSDTYSMEFYVNGVLQSTETVTGITFNGLVDMVIGEDFNGDIGEIRVWGKYCDSSHITRYLYRTLSGNEKDLLLYYRVNKHQGHYINDYSHSNFGGVIYSDDIDRFNSELLITLPFNLKERDTLILQKGKILPFNSSISITQSSVENIYMDEYTPELDVTFLEVDGISTNYTSGEGEVRYQVGDLWIEETKYKGNEDLYNILHSLYLDEKYTDKYKGIVAEVISIKLSEDDAALDRLKRRLDNDDDDLFSIYEFLEEYKKDYLKDYKLTSDLTELTSLIKDKELQAIIDRNIENDFDDTFFIQKVFKEWVETKQDNDSEEIISLFKQLEDDFENYKRIDNDNDDIFTIKDNSDKLYRKVDNDTDDIIGILSQFDIISKRIDNDNDDIMPVIEPISFRNKAYMSYYKSYSPAEDFYAIVRWAEEQAENRRIFRNIDNDSEELIGIIQHQIDEKYRYLKGYDETNDATLLDAIIKQKNEERQILENNTTQDMLYFIIKTIYGFYNVYTIDIDFTYNYTMDLEMLQQQDTYYMEVELI